MDVDTTSPLFVAAPMEVDVGIPSESSHSSIASNAVEPYSDDDHRRMDKLVTCSEVLDHVRDPGTPLAMVLPYVLQEVIRHDNRLDQSGLNNLAALGLIKKYPVLKSKLEDAWESGSYRGVRKLGTHVYNGWWGFVRCSSSPRHPQTSFRLLCQCRVGSSSHVSVCRLHEILQAASRQPSCKH